MSVCCVCACVPVEARGQSPVSALSSPCSLRQNCSLNLTLTDSRDWLTNVHHPHPPAFSVSAPQCWDYGFTPLCPAFCMGARVAMLIPTELLSFPFPFLCWH